MCLAVYANGTGAGAGIHVSISLLLMRGEFDEQLKWPMGRGKVDIKMLHQKQIHLTKQPASSGQTSLLAVPSATIGIEPIFHSHHLPQVIGRKVMFANHEELREPLLLYDSVVIQLVLNLQSSSKSWYERLKFW